MNVGELKKAISSIDDNLDIVVLRDPRGGYFEEIGGEITIGVFDENVGSFDDLDIWNEENRPEPNAIRLDS